MNKNQILEQLLNFQDITISITDFVINLILAALLSYIVGFMYIRYGKALSNRKAFAGNFIIIGVTTMVIITIVKSSIALSLGLVGALSIVRFRTPIKEPEELSYLFLVIAIGLGLGAEQRLIIIVGFLLIILLLWFKSLNKKQYEQQNLFLTIQSEANPSKNPIKLESVIETLNANCTKVNLKRFDESDKVLEATFLVEFNSFDDLTKAKQSLQDKHGTLKISFLDNK